MANFLKEAYKRVGKNGHDLFEMYNCRTHWCMMQVYYLIHDVMGIDIPKTFSCSVFKNTGFAKTRLNHDYKTAEVMDIILFENNGNRADGPDHVGLVVGNTGSSIKVLEGNVNGSNSDWCNTSVSKIFEYPYNYSGFECIIDMSMFPKDTADDTSDEPTDIPEEFELKIRTLKKGSNGKDVKALQRLLFADGYSCGPTEDDGDFGSNTERALKRYQTDHNLTSDGVAGPKTIASLWGC